jgi:hypothetical protein
MVPAIISGLWYLALVYLIIVAVENKWRWWV